MSRIIRHPGQYELRCTVVETKTTKPKKINHHSDEIKIRPQPQKSYSSKESWLQTWPQRHITLLNLGYRESDFTQDSNVITSYSYNGRIKVLCNDTYLYHKKAAKYKRQNYEMFMSWKDLFEHIVKR